MLTMDQCYESPEGGLGNGPTLCLLSWLQRSSAGDELGLRLKQLKKFASNSVMALQQDCSESFKF